MDLLCDAIAQYEKGYYERAKQLFIKAGEIYGKKLIRANVALCDKALKRDSGRVKENPHPKSPLDAATLLMLSNQGEVLLTDKEKDIAQKEFAQLRSRKSADAEIKPVNPIPSDWPKNITLPSLPDGTNDFVWFEKYKSRTKESSYSETRTNSECGLSIVIPTFNRLHLLDITLACLVQQKTSHQYEVIIADDGSEEDLTPLVRYYEALLDLRFVRQPDSGYQLCKVRNLGLRVARYDFVAILDCDMAPGPNWVETYVASLLSNSDIALIGPRKYVDTSRITRNDILNSTDLISSLPETITKNDVAGKIDSNISIDWRIEHFRNTDMLRTCDSPFRFFSGGNVAFAKTWLDRAGWFDEEFTYWGGEDNEFGYRLYRYGCFFKAVEGALAYHQEPPGKENETDRAAGKKITTKIVTEKVPYFYRKPRSINESVIHDAPLVSIYIPAYNCEDTIVRCINSALNQTIVDLEVCVCDDGSSDNTRIVLERSFGDNPRVRFITQENKGIGAASNAAVRLCRGYYIGQLDSDDYLEPDAVELCLNEFFKNSKLACVYTTNRNVKPSGEIITNGYNWPVFSREKMLTAMIAHHFRMFTYRAWSISGGFDEDIENAVDYDMFLKLSEIGPFKHVNKISYNRVLHGENTSIKKLGLQKRNHFKAVQQSLVRQGLGRVKYLPLNEKDDACRRYQFTVEEA